MNPNPPPLGNSPISEPELWDALRSVMDPEIGLNIVDLGLVYDLTIDATQVRVTMTVTTPGCPMVHSLTFGVETALLAVQGVEGVSVEVVHEPPWNPSMIDPAAREAAGIR